MHIQQLHRKPLIEYIIKHTGWSRTTFNLIHWEAHVAAFSRLNRQNQVQTSKIIHNLVNTNYQNHKFYGKSSLCPCCEQEIETLEHLLSCQVEAVSEHRAHSLLLLQNDLRRLSTPEPVIEAITWGE